jgi:acetyl-CoA carboxylase biotin carboxyl carrier protein
MKKTPKKTTPPTSMDVADIQSLIDLGEKNGLAEFEIEKAGVRVRIKYNRETTFVEMAPPTAAGKTPASMGARPALAPRPALPVELQAQAEEQNLHIVKSPIVGTFYAAPDPKAPPYVQVGDQVKPGQVLCIVEAMKLMNEIESEVTGEIVKILVQNAQPVEYGEALFAIRVS